MRANTLALLTALSLAVPSASFAQPADKQAEAQHLFDQARAAMEQGDYEQALKLLRMSLLIAPGRGKLVNMAICEYKLGRFGSALRHFQEVLPQLPERDNRIPIVKEHIAELTPKVVLLKIDLAPGAPAGTTVKLDKEVLSAAMLGTEIPVDPGKHVVVASAPGMNDATVEVEASEPGRKAISIAPTPPAVPAVVVVPRAAPPPPPPAEKPSRPITWTVGVAALGVGGASLITGIGTGAGAIAKHASTAKQCPAPDKCPSSVQSDIDTYHALGAASTATFVIGGAFAATGAVLLLVSRKADKPHVGSVEPLVGPGSFGVRGRF